MLRRFSTAFNFIHQPTWKSHPHILSPKESTCWEWSLIQCLMHHLLVIPGVRKEHYRERIDKLIAALPNGSIAIIPSYRVKYSTQNIFFPYQQNNDLLYLTGFNEPDSCLLISKSSNSSEISFFASPNDEHALLWSGPRAGLEGCKEIFGLGKVFDLRTLDDAIASFGKEWKIFLDHQEEHSSLQSSIYSKIKTRCQSLESILRPIRLVKSEEEIVVMKQSASIASEAFRSSMKYSLKARNEGELAAFMEFQGRSLGAERLAYVPVVAGSDRGLVIHYTHNNQLLKREDLVLMDAGVLYFGYCSDITRTWPLSGKFSAAQAKLYEAVLNVQMNCLQSLEASLTDPRKRGMSFGELNDLATYFTAVELDRLGFQDVEENVYRWFPHSIGHHLGLDLHDCRPCSQASSIGKLVPGNVFTVEPGVYVPHDDAAAPKEFHGLAIRIEDDIVLTRQNQLLNLSSAVPKHPKEIEEFLRQ